MIRMPFLKSSSGNGPIVSALPKTFLLALALLFMAAAPGALAANGDPFSVDQALSLRMDRPESAVRPAAPASPLAPVAEIPPLSPQRLDYSANLNSDVFGANLFTGAFARQGATQFNPDYAVAAGDNIHVRLWGAFEYDASLTVDPKGNIFLPHVGPVQVLGVRNQDLQGLVESAIGKVFRANVYGYASLAAAQPVRIFVGGFVHRPGLYSGTSMDSLLHYLDQAGGIDPERGSFLNVQVKRGSQIRATVSLYDFLLEGRMPLTQLGDGDVISPLGLRLEVLLVPGHTAGHIAYWGQVPGADPVLFCGDTLFSAGCGRLFEGTPAQMLASLTRLAALPEATRVCCAHEYTLGSLQFALAVEPDNTDLQAYQTQAQALRQQRLPTLPSSIGLERAVNPFLRTHLPKVAHAVQKIDPKARDPVAVFAALRTWKDKF